MDHSQLDALLKMPDRLRWIPVSSLLEGETIACIDGRHARSTVGAPGGSMGEFILLLAVAEFFTEQALGQARVSRLFDSFVGHFGSFYKHTDNRALATLATSLGLDRETIAAVVHNPPESLRETLLERLIEPAHIGCGHLRLLFDQNGPYRVREALIQHLLRAFFESLWSGRPGLQFEILEGEHTERALTAFHTRGSLQKTDMIPAWRPEATDPSIFVYHLAALRYVRREALEWLLESGELPGLAGCDPTTFLMETERLAERHLTLTFNTLAPTLPRHRVIFDQARNTEVPD